MFKKTKKQATYIKPDITTNYTAFYNVVNVIATKLAVLKITTQFNLKMFLQA